MRRTLVLAAALLTLGSATASAEDFFIGDWKLDKQAGVPWGSGDEHLVISSTTKSDVEAFARSSPGGRIAQLKSDCLDDPPGFTPAATTFYSATYSWSGGGTIKGCLSKNGNIRVLYNPSHSLREAQPTTESVFGGSWNDDSFDKSSFYFTAKRVDSEGCGSRRATAAAVNEVRVVAVQPNVQAHKAGTPPEEWHDVCKDTVLQQGDEISCDPDGAITLQFADNSTVVVRNTTQLKIASFFTEGGVVKTEILLKMGEVAAKVHKSEATKSDFRIKTGSGVHAGSVRGRSAPRGIRVTGDADFSAFYDPGSKTSLWTVREGSVEVSTSAKTTLLTAGQEALLAGAKTTVGKPGRAGARGGTTILEARDAVLKVVAKGNDPCKASTPRTNATSITTAPGGWAVTVKLIGKLKGSSKWTVKDAKVTAKNALAKKLKRGCR